MPRKLQRHGIHLIKHGVNPICFFWSRADVCTAATVPPATSPQAKASQLSFGAPALKGSALAMGNVDPLVTIVLNGRNGMPAFRGRIDAPDLAAILTYMRNAWGNNAMETIQTATVAALMQ